MIAALVLGFAFGWMLQRGGLTRYDVIVNVFRLRDLTVLRFLLVALAIGALGVQAALLLDVSSSVWVPTTRPLANLVGGVVFGVGMAAAGYCPGTIVAQAGEGHLDAWLAGLTGLIAGALVFRVIQPFVMPVLGPVGAMGRVTFGELLGVSPVLVAVIFAELVAVVLIAARHR